MNWEIWSIIGMPLFSVIYIVLVVYILGKLDLDNPNKKHGFV